MSETSTFQAVSQSDLDQVSENIEEYLNEAEGTEETSQEETVPTLAEVVRDVLSTFKGNLTMYMVAKALNAVLEIMEVTKHGEAYRVRPQMMYNYNKNKLIVHKVELDTAVGATKDQAAEFITRFVSKLIK